MKANDRARLTGALRQHVAKIAADLRVKMRAPGAVRARAMQLHADEQVAEDFEVWTDLLSRRAAVLWVLKSVYVRVLEDRGLLNPGRLLDPEAQQLFERLAPNLGETAFLRWVWRDLASKVGGLPELFGVQPAEVALPSDELSRRLIAFWRHRDADTGSHWSFAEERFEGELMGDLYQELDPVVKERFALCQTPDFVRGFILDRTLTPAIETFGADKVRMVDPACGSGHFLIDGLKRLAAATAGQHPEWARDKVVLHALDRVVGVDLNDYACALARTRLVMTAAELAGVGSLADAARFHPHVYWADGLEQVERHEAKLSLQFGLFEKVGESPRATLTRSDMRVALGRVFASKFDVVVANPPYNEELDEMRKFYQRELVGKERRYRSAHGTYSLGAPFVERCFQLAAPGAYVGVIVANNFMTRSFGKPLIEKVLSNIDLTLVADLSGAILASSGFEVTTILLCGRQQPPVRPTVRAVFSLKGDTDRPSDLSTGAVWSSLIAGWDTPGFANDYVTVDDAPREMFRKHPWTMRGGGAVALRARIERYCGRTLRSIGADVGRAISCGEDPVFVMKREDAERVGAGELARPLATGKSVRDWTIRSSDYALYPYVAMGAKAISESHPAVRSHFWRYRTLLRARSIFGRNYLERGSSWFGYLEHYEHRLRTPLAIAMAEISTHNQFALSRGDLLLKETAPIIKLSEPASEDDYLALLGLLNSSTMGFWLRQVVHKYGGRSSGTRKQSESWAQRYQYKATPVYKAPLPTEYEWTVKPYAAKLDTLARRMLALSPSEILGGTWEPEHLAETLKNASAELSRIRCEMVALQEELDWAVYVVFGLVTDELTPAESVEALAPAHRPFAIRLARQVASGDATPFWFEAMGVEAHTAVPLYCSTAMRERIERRLGRIEENAHIGLLESPEYKRKWDPLAFGEELERASLSWLTDRVEDAVRMRNKVIPLSHVAAALQGDSHFLAVASIYHDRRDVDVDVLLAEIASAESVPSHSYHCYTETGLTKLAVWETIWALQRREDAGESVTKFPESPEYSQGSRGKSTDFLRTEYWQLRGKLDVPKERFIAFTEVPGHSGADTLYGWAGWTPLQRLKAILAIDEDLEDAGTPLADRIGLLDSAWRLLPDVAREDAPVATRLKAELQAVVGPDGPSRELLEDWRKRFPPPTARATKAKRAVVARAEPGDDEEGDDA